MSLDYKVLLFYSPSSSINKNNCIATIHKLFFNLFEDKQ